ncbi:hypothetical protein C8Q73DRAFT_108301 [Cubamyces lactineus]|nr:hypothetical protein C8Q73DRAFT_108301 [Cubamyces lactineus]
MPVSHHAYCIMLFLIGYTHVLACCRKHPYSWTHYHIILHVPQPGQSPGMLVNHWADPRARGQLGHYRREAEALVHNLKQPIRLAWGL